ncbi:hypothetical protein AB0K12_47250 [Nonomuraea sp. NPDC049419]|uniref:hypothetical protein n=1 Tax=Nonomuraea sp. NPDC049419 TaxID=3155772 RepID=UPI00342167C7
MDKLDSSPFPGDLREELAVRPARGLSKVTLALGAGVVLVAGILVGIQAHSAFGSSGGSSDRPLDRPLGRSLGRSLGTPQAGPSRQAAPGERPGGMGREGRRPGGAGGGTTGTVEKVEDGTVHLKTVTGESVTVATTGETTVQISKPGKVADLKPGATVVVRGTPGEDGTVTATSITQGGPAARGGGPR